MAQVQLVSKQMSAQHTDVTNRVEELKTNEIANKLGIKTMKDNIEQLTKFMRGNIVEVKKEIKDETKKLFEQNTNTKMSLGSSIADVEEKLSQTINKLDDEVQNFNDETFAVQGSIADLNEELTKLATKSNMWDAIEKKLEHHVRTLGKECTTLEEGASSSKPTTLSLPLQRYLAGNTQRIAKLIATKADFEVIRKIVMATDPATTDWDVEVTSYRNSFLTEFIGQVQAEAMKKHPITDMLVEEAREKFLGKLSLAIKVAISKYSRVQIGSTLLGRRQLVPTCMACDRPFNKEGGAGGAGGGGGDMRGVSRDPLPMRPDDDSSIASYTSMADGSRNSNNYNVVPFGVDQRKLDKYVFRAGFKIPKHINSPLQVGGGGPDMFYPDDGSMGSLDSMGSLGSGGGSRRPHTVAYGRKGGGKGGKGGGGGGGSNFMLGSSSVGRLPDVASPSR